MLDATITDIILSVSFWIALYKTSDLINSINSWRMSTVSIKAEVERLK